MERVSKRNYYLDIAQTVLERATCLRRVYGAIIVKNDEIISTGYNGAPRFAAASAPTRTPSSPLRGATWWARPFTLSGATRAPARCCTMRRAAPCAAA